MECERLVLLGVGIDRTIVVGRVLAMHVRDEAVIDPVKCYIDTPKLNLIGRMHGRGWYVRTTDRVRSTAHRRSGLARPGIKFG